MSPGLSSFSNRLAVEVCAEVGAEVAVDAGTVGKGEVDQYQGREENGR